MNVKDLMSTKIEHTTPDTGAKEAAHLMHETHVGVLPVLDDDKLVGMITDRDICCKVVATGHSAGRTKVSEIMSMEVATCFDDQNIGEATEIMIKNHVHRLAVVNRDNTVVGVLSVDDLAKNSHDMAGSVLEASMQAH
jgi:CBS domain-containing protein